MMLGLGVVAAIDALGDNVAKAINEETKIRVIIVFLSGSRTLEHARTGGKRKPS